MGVDVRARPGITAALLGWIGPIQAAIIHWGPDVLVFVNSVKLLRVRIAGAWCPREGKVVSCLVRHNTDTPLSRRGNSRHHFGQRLHADLIGTSGPYPQSRPTTPMKE